MSGISVEIIRIFLKYMFSLTPQISAMLHTVLRINIQFIMSLHVQEKAVVPQVAR